MYNLAYVKKRQRRKVAAIASGVASLLVTIFTTISFIGHKVGSFSINLRNSDVQLALSTTSTFDSPTTLLHENQISTLYLYCYQSFKDPQTGKEDFSQIDSEFTTFKDFAQIDSKTGEITSLLFFKYTFFIGNIGPVAASYDMKLNIVSDTSTDFNERSLDGYLRVICLKDGYYDKTVYAKEAASATHFDIDEPGKMTSREYIDGDPSWEHLYEGLTVPFESKSVIATIKESRIDFHEVTRYTLIFWLEGDDEDATGTPPEHAKLSIGVDINAYEYKEK